jgi:transposase-like protein
VTKLRALKLPVAAELMEAKGHEMLSYHAFPINHWRQLRTYNPLQRPGGKARLDT